MTDGRINQGLYPFKAPRGYLDRGRGRAKVPDPQTAPLVIAAFSLYAEATYSLHSLADELHVRGLATEQGQPLSPNSLSRMLRNPFYAGQVVVKGRQTPGKHQPLVSSELFSRVQTVLTHRRPARRHKHVFRYRGQLQCTGCQRCLIGEKQKQHVYYRCGRCKGICVREDRVEDADPRFSILFRATPANEPLLEPYERFDSPKGGRRFGVL